MPKLSLSQTFAVIVRSQIPDPEKPGVFRTYEFPTRYKTYPSTQENRDRLQKLQEDQGLNAFLDEIVVSVDAPKDVDLVDENDTPITATEWAKRHMVVQGDLATNFWEVINKGVIEKNSKRSRGR